MHRRRDGGDTTAVDDRPAYRPCRTPLGSTDLSEQIATEVDFGSATMLQQNMHAALGVTFSTTAARSRRRASYWVINSGFRGHAGTHPCRRVCESGSPRGRLSLTRSA
jgi:hypothetical protein